MLALVDQCVQAGLQLRPGECYTYRHPPVLGGDYTLENTAVTTLSAHYGFYGDLHLQARGVADGQQVVLRLRRDA
jgi:hypothetical protein